MTDKFWMQKAYEEALTAQSEGEVPVGAVLVSEQGELLGLGRNSSQKQCDPSCHAEFVAIRQAALAVKNHRLLNTTLYVTLEPCVMCAGLLVQARVKRLVFATRDVRSGAAGSAFNVLSGFPLNHQVIIDEGVMQAECSALLRTFFEGQRSQIRGSS